MNYMAHVLAFKKPDEIDLYQFYSIKFEDYKDYSKFKIVSDEQYIISVIFLMRRRYQYPHLKTGGGGERK